VDMENFGPIILASFLIKAMGRMVDRFPIDEALAYCHSILINMLTRLRNPCKQP